ncbi:MAG: hypothetical protein FD138_2903 [Planctomycetota bacterium]|nr:MAG: hypothetical protein FD138_2903 [Planctomycetota bacterium]
MRQHQHFGREGSFRGDLQHLRTPRGDVQRGTTASADPKQSQRQLVEIGPRINVVDHRVEVQDFILRQPVQRHITWHRVAVAVIAKVERQHMEAGSRQCRAIQHRRPMIAGELRAEHDQSARSLFGVTIQATSYGDPVASLSRERLSIWIRRQRLDTKRGRVFDQGQDNPHGVPLNDRIRQQKHQQSNNYPNHGDDFQMMKLFETCVSMLGQRLLTNRPDAGP